MSCESEFHWTSGARTDVGPVRSRNEDAYLVQPQRGLWAVADGMGGHAFGDLASRAVVDALAALPPPRDIADFIASARASLGHVNQALRASALERHVPVIGSTVVALLACGRDTASLWAGDSRIYLYRQGRLQQLTRDHSQAEELKARGADPAAVAVSANMITRAIGAAEAIEFDVTPLVARDGDVFLLCSDGLSNPVDEQAIATVLANADSERAAQELVSMALANGGRDNVTAVVVRADDLSADRTMINPAL